MKVIDLLNKIANGEEVPKRIRIDHWSYNFKWMEHDSNYYDKNIDIDLMSCLSMDKEELNYGIQIIEDKTIRKLPKEVREPKNFEEVVYIAEDLARKINEIIDQLNEMNDK